MKYHVNLSDRNKMVVDKVTDKFNNDRYCAEVSAPGTGKSYVSLELICRNMDKSTLFLAPTNAILNQFKSTIAQVRVYLVMLIYMIWKKLIED